jgi:hypothetical protein
LSRAALSIAEIENKVKKLGCYNTGVDPSLNCVAPCSGGNQM